jgi:hypothetical protein
MQQSRTDFPKAVGVKNFIANLFGKRSIFEAKSENLYVLTVSSISSPWHLPSRHEELA